VSCRSAAGSVTVTDVPPADRSGSTSIFPPMASMKPLQIDKHERAVTRPPCGSDRVTCWAAARRANEARRPAH
jgi:hypothetical protein